MVLSYRPDDGNIPQKLDAIFWEKNRPIIVGSVTLVLLFIGLSSYLTFGFYMLKQSMAVALIAIASIVFSS